MTLEERYYKELHGSFFRITNKLRTGFSKSPDFYFDGLNGDKVILRWDLRVTEEDGSINLDNIAVDNYSLKNTFIHIDGGYWILCDERKRDNHITDLLE